MVPRRDVFPRANPYIEIRADPGCRKNSVVSGNLSGCRGGLTRCQRLYIGIVVDFSVKLPQELAAIAAEILPRIFSVQDQRNCQWPPDMNPFSNHTNTLVKIIGCRISVHPAVDEAHQVRQIVIAKESD